jgi:hypothetical protein
MMGQMHALALAKKKLAAQLCLQGFDGVADGALREVQLTARRSETAASG